MENEKCYMFQMAMTEKQIELMQRGIILAMQEANYNDDGEFANDMQMAVYCADEIEN